VLLRVQREKGDPVDIQHDGNRTEGAPKTPMEAPEDLFGGLILSKAADEKSLI